MKTLQMMGAAAMAVVVAVSAYAGEVQSGVPVGGSIGTYSTTKCGGVDDGVSVGSTLCYT